MPRPCLLLAGADAGPAGGGIAGVGPAAGGMAAPHGSMTAFNNMRHSYLAHLALADAAARTAALRERGPFKPLQVEPFNAGPGYIRVFADMLERCLKLSTTITVARYYCDNEELGMAGGVEDHSLNGLAHRRILTCIECNGAEYRP
jgi:hypothetical protein